MDEEEVDHRDVLRWQLGLAWSRGLAAARADQELMKKVAEIGPLRDLRPARPR